MTSESPCPESSPSHLMTNGAIWVVVPARWGDLVVVVGEI